MFGSWKNIWSESDDFNLMMKMVCYRRCVWNWKHIFISSRRGAIAVMISSLGSSFHIAHAFRDNFFAILDYRVPELTHNNSVSFSSLFTIFPMPFFPQWWGTGHSFTYLWSTLFKRISSYFKFLQTKYVKNFHCFGTCIVVHSALTLQPNEGFSS